MKLLGVYVNDHLAGATAGVELAKRLLASHRGTPMEGPLEAFVGEVTQDRAALVDIMSRLDLPVQRYKTYAGWIAEKAGRLKLNGHLLSRSPLSSLIELEMMRLGVEGKAAGWRTLLQRAPYDERLDVQRLEDLLDRARRQSEMLEHMRLRTAKALFAV
jgi:hypothetical protein